jgi:hypothetical protein
MGKSKYSNCGSTKTKSGGINFFGTPKDKCANCGATV